MDFDLEEAIGYYKRQGAPRDQNALVNCLREVQDHHGGTAGHGLSQSKGGGSFSLEQT